MFPCSIQLRGAKRPLILSFVMRKAERDIRALFKLKSDKATNPLSMDKDWARGYKTFFYMLKSAEHEILNAYKYKSIKKFSYFQA